MTPPRTLLSRTTPGGARSRRKGPFAGLTVYPVGHSTRSQEELIALLWAHGVATLVDIRTVPRSRTNPQFNREELTRVMPKVGLGYHHLAELGGLRYGLGAASPNQGWRNKSFRGYADHMLTEEFASGLEQLQAWCAQGPCAVMCAEALRWRCHRSLLADALWVRGATVLHLETEKRSVPHRLTPFAKVRGLRITYPQDPRSTAVARTD